MFGLFPLLYSLGVSFLNWDLQRQGQQFIGLKNYADVIADGRMWNALRNTLVIVVIGVAIELVFGLALAQTLVGRLPGKRLFIPLLILPAVITPLVAGHMWYMLFDAQYGPIDHILSLIFRQPVNIVWLINPQTVYPALLLVEIWQWTPFMFLILLAGLAAVNPELTKPPRSWRVRLANLFSNHDSDSDTPDYYRHSVPRLDLFKLFDIIYALTNGGPGTMTETASLYVYTLGFKNFRLGYAAAACTFYCFLSQLSSVYCCSASANRLFRTNTYVDHSGSDSPPQTVQCAPYARSRCALSFCHHRGDLFPLSDLLDLHHRVQDTG